MVTMATNLSPLVLLMTSLSLVHCELFTAIVHMEGLLNLERGLLEGLNEYITAEKQRLQSLEQFASNVKHAHDLVNYDDPQQHLGDPINAYQLVNRYTNGWMNLHDSVYMDNGQDLMANISLNNYRLPSNEDYKGAITALRRLQVTYDLRSSVMASGEISKADSLELTAHDCYKIGREAYLEKDYQQSRDWMKTTLDKFDNGDTEGVDLVLVYDHLAFSEYSIGNIKRAAQYNKDLLQNEPTHERAIANKEYFDDLRVNKPDQYVDQEYIELQGTERLEPSEKAEYEALCREGKPYPPEEHHKLVCFYFDNGRNPRLIIRPVKVEIAHPEPRIYILRDIISEAEMNRLKELAGPILKRATARNWKSGQFEPASYRISKSGWLSKQDDPLGYVERIDQRIADVTGLTMETAEQLQVVNYGIGGHYEPHFDFARKDEDAFSGLGNGNRISTVLFYMSEVEVGGATVFPILGARIPPTKGDAAYWWNLKKSGDGDLLTRHAGCPVLVGSKWVCNKWIHERGQEFNRPCGLSPDE